MWLKRAQAFQLPASRVMVPNTYVIGQGGMKWAAASFSYFNLCLVLTFPSHTDQQILQLQLHQTNPEALE
jgi:hypothetical protein